MMGNGNGSGNEHVAGHVDGNGSVNGSGSGDVHPHRHVPVHGPLHAGPARPAPDGTLLECQRQLFSLPDDVHYLNCAYMSPLLRSVEEAGIEGIRRKRVPSEIVPADFFADRDRVRALFAQLINAPDASRVALVPAASYGLAVVARNTRLGKGQNIVVVEEQFPSNVHVWARLCRAAGGELRTVRRPEGPGAGAAWTERVLEAMDAATAVVAMPQVHWTDGTRFDLLRIGARARELGAALVIDGTQSVGALPFDVQAIQPDALVCAGYKWLLAPYATGVAWYGPRYDGGIPLEETWIAREGSEDFRSLVHYRDAYQPGAARYDAGGSPNFILVPMLAAALEQVLAWTPDAIQAYCAELTRELLEEAAALGFGVEEEAWRAAHLFGLRMPAGVDLASAQALLTERRISVSLRGNAMRVSPHVYNDERDVAALREALRAIAGAA